MYRFLFLFMVLPCVLYAGGTDPYFFTTSLQKGEGVYALLDRYELNNSCNVAAFYSINRLEKDSPLYMHKKYKIPVKIYRYDGRSIRSSIGITDWDIAVQIKEYNESIQSKGIRSTHYADSKILWVPMHFLECPEMVSNTEEIVSEVRVEEKIIDDKGTKETVITTLAPETKKGTNSLFGPKYATYDIGDNSLKDQVFYQVLFVFLKL